MKYVNFLLKCKDDYDVQWIHSTLDLPCPGYTFPYFPNDFKFNFQSSVSNADADAA